MLGAIIVAVIIVIALPVAYFVTGAVIAVLLGWTLKDNGEATHEDSPLLETNY